MDKRARVMIVEDEALIRSGLEMLLQSEADFEVVGSAANGAEALGLFQPSLVDVILMDIKMPVMDGITCIQRIRELDSNVIILILTTFNEEAYIVKGLGFGANGYLLKGGPIDVLLQTIKNAMNGQYLLPAEVATKLSAYLLQQQVAATDTLPEFITAGESYTNRELDILKLLKKRLTNREIAEQLGLGEGTLRNLLTVIYEKMQVSNRYDAIEKLNHKLK